MPIEFNCLSCSRLLRVPDGSGGKACQCPGCGELLEIPAPGKLTEDGLDANTSDGKLHIPCPKCKHHLVCEPKLLGTKGQCRNCQHIFMISNAPAALPSTTEKAANWVFSCPKCNQLFEGLESMNGRRGKCHACGDVFDIKLRVAQDDASRPQETEKRKATPATTPPAESAKPTGAFRSSSEKPNATSNTSKVSKSANVSKSGKAAKPVAAVSKEPIRFNCFGCTGTMEVPGATAGQMTICPYCKIQLKIPPASTVSITPTEPATVAPQVSGDIWSNLDVFGPTSTQPANVSFPASSQPTNYAPTAYAPINYQPTPYATPRRSRSSSNNGFLVCGILIIISSALEILYLIYQIASVGIAMSRPLPPVEGIMIYFGIAIALMVLGLILVIVKLFGGIAMVRRAGLASAKTGAIISCLPCLCCIVNVPIGIWACILTFSSDAERRFSY